MKNIPFRSVLALVLFMLTFLAISCKDHKHDDPAPAGTEPATITFTSPAAHSSVSGAQVVTVAGKIEAAKQIHGYKIIIRNKTNNTETVIKNAHDHGTQVSFSADWTNNVSGHCDMEAEVVVSLDHDGNTLSAKVPFHCML